MALHVRLAYAPVLHCRSRVRTHGLLGHRRSKGDSQGGAARECGRAGRWRACKLERRKCRCVVYAHCVDNAVLLCKTVCVRDMEGPWPESATSYFIAASLCPCWILMPGVPRFNPFHYGTLLRSASEGPQATARHVSSTGVHSQAPEQTWWMKQF